MRKLIRPIFTTLSLLLLIATLGIWVRSQWALHRVELRRFSHNGPDDRRSTIGFAGTRGSLGIGWDRTLFGPPLDDKPSHLEADMAAEKPFKPGSDSAQSTPSPEELRRAGYTGIGHWGFLWLRFDWSNSQGGMRGDYLNQRLYSVRSTSSGVVGIPWWFLTVIFSLLPLRAFWPWRKSRRPSPGHCRHCGYDLRSTADGTGPLLAICPECGQASDPPALNAAS